MSKKRWVMIALIVITTVLLVGCSKSPEEKKTELSGKVAQIEDTLRKMDEVSAFWQETFKPANLSNFAEAKKRMDFTFEKAMENAKNIKGIEAPSWMNDEAKKQFNNMIKSYDNANQFMAASARKASAGFEKSSFSKYESDEIIALGQQYQAEIIKGAAVFSGFKNGYGLEEKK